MINLKRKRSQMYELCFFLNLPMSHAGAIYSKYKIQLTYFVAKIYMFNSYFYFSA